MRPGVLVVALCTMAFFITATVLFKALAAYGAI